MHVYNSSIVGCYGLPDKFLAYEIGKE